ncbi:HAMP domain-containing sensor histidine kinase [Paenibacillus sp. J22TS3]|uniref:HAMP domain-containing sensor histidine kinase n=1 Tax=Paenibacillus sp. J22TS3 TaxID=2807192 RepID=UPI001B134317|nr:HAMP domain-containing sensor histidine kinase [Paenibacillus sp. J22TS3]GIP22235.1 two-component sensor histidine kinase [Paenibacillus sp. J22TS3]
MTRSLYVRVVLTFLAAMGIGLLVSVLAGLALFEERIDRIGQNDLTAAGEEIIHVYEQTKPADLDRFMESMVKLTSYSIQLYSGSGAMKSFKYDSGMDDLAISQESIRKVREGGVYRSSSQDEMTFIGLPFQVGGERQALFLLPSSKNESTLTHLLLTILLLVLVTGSICILIAAIYVVRPIKTLTAATKRLAKGDFDVELGVKRRDELGDLARSFNEMALDLKQLEQMRQDFVSNVSHEIQSPLTSISGFAKALKDINVIAEDERIQYLDIILAESGRLSRLSDNLLKLASLDSNHHPLEYTTFHLDEHIRQVVVNCEPLWSAKNLDITLDLPQSAVITADMDQLNQVWTNLLSNSIKFTPDGGLIHVQLRTRKDGYAVTLSDSGIGIAPEQLGRVFERFYKTDRSRSRSGGSGLGLAIVKKIVALHHGDIIMESQVGQGTKVVVHLPANPPNQA